MIVVSGSIREGIALAATKAGAYDYVMKDNAARLCASIERALTEADERRRGKQAEQSYVAT